MDGPNGPASSSSASQNTSSTPRGNGTHAHLRYFVGPLPDKIVSDTETRFERSRFRTFLRLPGSSEDDGGANAVSEAKIGTKTEIGRETEAAPLDSADCGIKNILTFYAHNFFPGSDALAYLNKIEHISTQKTRSFILNNETPRRLFTI